MKRFFVGAFAALFSALAFATTYVPVQLLNPAGSTSGQTIVSSGPTTSAAWSNVSATALAAQAANTVVANVTGSSASPTAFAMPSCSSSTSALQYTLGTGWTCYTSSATTTGTLAQFAATTSAQLAGVLSDETGSGAAVFGTNPTITGATISGGTGSFTTLSASGTLSGITGRLLNVRTFATTGTYTPTTGTAAVYVRVQGAGGAGGGTPATSTGQSAAGSGGSAGTYAEGYFTSGFSGVTITVGAAGAAASGANGGAGGTSSFGSLLSCPGGPGGLVGTASTAWTTSTSGLAGAETGTALYTVRGQQGAQSQVISATVSFSGAGASSPMGTGGPGLWSPAAGQAGTGAGSGGGGANAAASTAAQAGSIGTPGVVEVFEFSN